MTKEITVVNGTDVAVVRLTEKGEVEIIRDGNTVKQVVTLDEVIDKFKMYGWSVAEANKTREAAAVNNIPVQTQEEVDEYLQLHAAKAELETKMNKLKTSIKGYMDNNNIKEVSGTNGKKIYLQDAAASNSTAVFSNYELSPVMAALNNNDLLRQVTEVRVNSEKLEAMLKLDKLPEEKITEIKALKIVKAGTPRFSVKK